MRRIGLMLAFLMLPLCAGDKVQRFEKEGVAVEFSVSHIKQGRSAFQVGDDAMVRFRISDTTSGKPLANLYPAAWMDTADAKADCKQKIETFLGGSLWSRAHHDLNVYYVVALNDDATLTVVDPLFGFGTTKLLAIVNLEAPGEDWVITEDQRRIFVSMPSLGKVAVVDTATWEVSQSIEVGPYPTVMKLQADEHFLWIANDRHEDAVGGVTAVNTKTLAVEAAIPTGRGHHRMVVTPDNRHVLVSNSLDGTVSVINVASLQKRSDVATGDLPASLDYSAHAGLAYISHQGDGGVVALDIEREKVIAKIPTNPGLGQLRVSPDGRLVLTINPILDELYVIDAATNKIIKQGKVRSQPHQINFSDTIAYISHLGSEIVFMLPMLEASRDSPLSLVDFPGGEHAPATMVMPSPAAGIVQAPGANAVLIANPNDQAIYYYMEGMAAPKGHFKNYGRQPRAVLVVDRSLKEHTTSGTYETVVRLDKAGTFDVPFFMDAPRMTHCFNFEVLPNPDDLRPNQAVTRVKHLRPGLLNPGQESSILVRLTDRDSGAALEDLKDVGMLITLSAGIWHKRFIATYEGDGVYRVNFKPSRSGVYYVYTFSPSAKLHMGNKDYKVYHAIAKKADKDRL